ncbi:MAG: DUF2273 domain-containing protein [Coriobacteriales bacterium]|nr:DUF2273 domain-containing protein [Coriobacteriales bacterium]
MSQQNGFPKPRVESEGSADRTERVESAPQKGVESARNSQQATGQANPSSDGAGNANHAAHFSQAVSSARSWVARTFPGHENAVLFGFLGFLVALLVFIIGFWQTLFIALVVLVGVAIGQKLDGDPKIINAVRRFVRENRN